MAVSVLKVKDAEGNIIDIPAIKGDAGPQGPAGKDGADGADYVLTDADKEEIANMAAPVDQAYNPTSENAQSGIAVAEAIGDIETAIDNIIAIQNSLIGGESE